MAYHYYFFRSKLCPLVHVVSAHVLVLSGGGSTARHGRTQQTVLFANSFFFGERWDPLFGGMDYKLYGEWEGSDGGVDKLEFRGANYSQYFPRNAGKTILSTPYLFLGRSDWIQIMFLLLPKRWGAAHETIVQDRILYSGKIEEFRTHNCHLVAGGADPVVAS